MKNKVALIALAFLSSTSVMAQSEESELKPFKVDVSLGYAIPGGSGSKAGVLFAIEPKYAVMPSLAVGLRMEAAVIARFSGYDANGDALDASVKAAGSYLATADYYFNNNYSFRPFAGAGAGIFSLAAAEVDDDVAVVDGGTKFGGMLRAGFEARHFRLGLEYNLVPKSSFNGIDNNGEPAKLSSKNAYLGIKLGICIGGGPR